MTRERKIFCAKVAAILSVIPVLLWAHPSGADPGNAGVPGENPNSCANALCHGGTINSGPGSLVIDTGGSSYTAGARKRIKVTVSDPDQRRWGFQLTARLASDPRTMAGTFTLADAATTQVICSGANLLEAACGVSAPLQFVIQTTTGTRAGTTGGSTWEVDWTPPSSDVGSVVFYAAGNAANNNGLNTGDRIYAKTETVTAQPSCPTTGPKPVIAANGVVHGASFQPGIAPVTWITITGSELAGATRQIGAADISGGNLPALVDCVGVTVNGKAAFPNFLSSGQLNVQSPSDSSAGPVQVVVTRNGVASDPATVPLASFSPAFFQWPSSQAVSTDANFQLRVKPGTFAGATTVAAKPGEVIILWGTGFGPSNPDVPAGQLVTAATVANAVTVRVGSSQAEVFGAAMAPGFASLVQVAIRVPDLADGDYPVVATVGGASSPTTTVLAVRR